MRASPKLLQILRLTPEPVKRRLRPALLLGVQVAAKLPGAHQASRLVRLLLPGGHDWLRRRFHHYAETADILQRIGAVGGREAPPADLSASERLVFAQLRGLAGRPYR